MAFKLGKGLPVHDDRTLMFSKYAAALPPLPALPSSADFMSKVPSWPMFGNDTLGDCVAAAAGHLIQGNTFSAGKGIVPTLADVINFYKLSGYRPGDPSSDQGWEILPMLKDWRSLGLGGDKIVAYGQLKTGNYEELRQAISLFGGAILGFALPDAVVPNDPSIDWTKIPWAWNGRLTPNPANGHCVPAMAYIDGWPGFVSWAAGMGFDKPFYKHSSDEAWFVVTQDFIDKDGVSPSGFDIQTLLADQALVTA